MTRTFFSSLLMLSVVSAAVHAQDWAGKMFDVKSYDFGTIARGAKAEIAFELTNLYMEDVHIASVRSTCGCTTPRIEKETLKSHEKGAIVAHINSDKFLGHQSATITVTIDKPQFAQVQLHVKVYVYTDVLLEPSSIALGSFAQGTPIERTIRVQCTGHGDWQILKVRSDNPHLTGSVTETSRAGDRVAYDLTARVDTSAPVGYVTDYLWLATNDPRAKEIPVHVDGQVLAAISVSPSSLLLGVVQPGQSVTKQLVVRGQTPFRITSMRADCGCLLASAPKNQESKTLHLVPVTFTAGTKTGKISQTISIKTDAGPMVLKVVAHAVVDGQ